MISATRSRDEAFDIWHEVPLVPQLTGMSCWAAAAAMIIGWRDCLDIDPEDVARASGRWADYRDGMRPDDIDAFADTWGLHVEPVESLTIAHLRDLLQTNGPLWVGEASDGLHVIVIAGVHGDGTPEGTFVRVLDPWPEGRGERYTLKMTDLLDSLRAAHQVSGVPTRILHTGGRGRGASASSYRIREDSSTFVQFDRPDHAERYGQPRFGTPYGVLQHYARGSRPPAHPPGNGHARTQSSYDAATSAVATLDPPDRIATRQDGTPLDDSDWYSDADLAGEPAGTALLTVSDAAWAEDSRSPDFRHLSHAGSSLDFELTSDLLRELFLVNRFDVTGGQDEVLFGLRGCRLTGDAASEGQFADTALLSEDLPDHVGFHCVIGVYQRSTGQIAVFSASTVPNWALMEQERAAGADAKIANLLPTGCYTYHVGKHRAVDGAFILQPDVLVLRSRDNLVYEVGDSWERHSPGDNIHPSFTGQQALFSSAGCQTVPGRWTAAGGHQGLWSSFRAAAGLGPDNQSGWGNQYTYCLLTGREARLMGEVSQGKELARLRFGSQGDAVKSLQKELARAKLYTGDTDGRLGAATALAFVQWQRDHDVGAADAIVTPMIADAFGFDL